MHHPALQWRAFWMALAASISLCALLWAAAPPRYDTNDDVAIRLSLEGRSIPGQPGTGYVLFSHAALGWTLQALASRWPAVPWWDLVISGLLLWSVAIVLAVGWNAIGGDWLGPGIGVAMPLIALVPLVVSLQFTISATLGGGAAMLLAFLELTAPARPRRAVLGMSAALLALAVLVRPMGAMAGAGSCAVFLLPAALGRGTLALDDRRGLPRWTRLRAFASLAAAGVVALLVFATLAITDSWLYRAAPEWNQYAQYNGMLARLFEWGGSLSSAQADAMRAAAGWTSNDWQMLPAMWGVDSTVHGFDRLSHAYEISAAAAPGTIATVRGLIGRAAGLAQSDSARLLAESSSILIAALVVAVLMLTRRGVAAMIASLILFCAVCIVIEAAFKTLPFRVVAPIAGCFAAAALVTFASFRRPAPATARVLALGIVLGILVQESTTIAGSVRAGLRHMKQVGDEMEQLRNLRPSLVVRHADTFPAEIWWRPFHRPPFDLPSVALGWNDQNPLLQRFLTASGRQPLLRAACSDPSILVIAARPDRLEPVTTYMREHFHEEVAWTRVNTGSFAAWRCTSRGPAPEVPASATGAAAGGH
jgi:hypothetical protein